MNCRGIVVLVLLMTCGLVRANHMRIRNMRMQMRMPFMRRVPMVTTTPKPTTTTPAGEYEPPEIEGPVSTSTTKAPTTTTIRPRYPPHGHGFHFGRGGHFGGPPFGHRRFGHRPGGGGRFHRNFGPGFKPNARMAMHNSINNGFFPKRSQSPQFFGRPSPPPVTQTTHSGKWIEIGGNNLRMGPSRGMRRPFPRRDGGMQFSRPGGGNMGGRSTVSSSSSFSNRRGGNFASSQPSRNNWNSEQFRNSQQGSFPRRQNSRQFDNAMGGRGSSGSFGQQDTFFNNQRGGGRGSSSFGGNRNSGFSGSSSFGRDRGNNFGGGGNMQPSNWRSATTPMPTSAQAWNTPRNPPMPNPPPPAQSWVTPAPKPWALPTQAVPTTTMRTNSFTDVWGYPTTAASNWFLGASKKKTNSISSNNNQNSNANSQTKTQVTTQAIQAYIPTTQPVISNDPFVGMFGSINRMMSSMLPQNPMMNYMMFATK